jgi:hypothetical protein
MDAPTHDDLFRVARDAMLAANPRLTRATIERQGTDYNAITAGMVAVGDEVVAHNTIICASQILDACRGDKLTRYAFDKYNTLRKPASVSLGSVQISSPTLALVGYTIPANLKLSATDGKQYVTTSTFPVTSGTSGPYTVSVKSSLAGKSQQAGVGTITSILDPITNAPAGMRVTNPLATAAADDEEEDEDLRIRARNFYETQRAGTMSALELKAISYPGVRKAAAFETVDVLGRPSKSVELVISDAFTDVLINTVDASYQVQSQVLADLVYASLSDTRGAGIHVNVYVAQVILLSVLLALNFTADADIEDTALRARAAIVSYVNSLKPGGDFSIDDALTSLKGVPGLVVMGTEILSPVGNVAAANGQVLRTSLAFVRASTLQPDRALQGSTNPDTV